MDPSDTNFWIAYALTIFIIVAKFTLSGYLFKKYRTVEVTGQHKLNFIMGMCLLIFGLGIARSIYFYYDFYLTKYDPNLLYIMPNVLYWKTALFIGTLFSLPLLYVVERDVYQFKTKRIPTIILGLMSLVVLLFPITSKADFEFVSLIGSLSFLLALLVPAAFIYLAIKTSGQLKKVSIMLATAIIAYGIISVLMSENVLAALDAAIPGIRPFIIILFPIAKVVSLILITYATVNFRV